MRTDGGAGAGQGGAEAPGGADAPSVLATAPGPASGARRAWLSPVGIFLTFFAAYLITMSRERPWADANPVYQVAENLLKDRSFESGIRWPADSPPGRDDKYYAYNPLLTSLVHVPGAYVRLKLLERWRGTAFEPLSLPWACHVAPAAAGALCCVLFFGLCRQHGFSTRVSSLGTLLVGFGSIVWVYAHYPYTEILQAAAFTGFVLQTLRAADRPGLGRGLALGAWAGLLLNTKLVFAAALPGPALLLLWGLRRQRPALLRLVAGAALALIPAVAIILFYNWVRFGSVTNSGYNAYAADFFGRGRLFVGLWGYLLSPGKSLFLYVPPLLLSVYGARSFVRGHRRTALVVATAAAPVVLTYARYAFWHGDYAWGPRYVVFLAPVLLLPAVGVLDALAARRRRLALYAVFSGALAAGAVVQVLGLAFYWDHYIRIARDAKTHWLGAPNRGGAVTPDRGGMAGCDGCYEDLYQLHWLPQFQPILGHLWLARHVPFGHDWETAEKGAPWRPDTTLSLPLAGTYQRARVDWWPLDYADFTGVAAGIFAALAALLGLGVAGWALGGRTRRPAAVPAAAVAPVSPGAFPDPP